MMNRKDMLKRIQETELDALCEFQKICDANNIKFYMRGGSVMGSIKYKGFIPWDDDIDLAVPREDYEHMLEIFGNKEIAGKYKLLSYRYCEDLHSYIPRIFLIESERKKLHLPANTKLGLYLIDIFPIDGAPNNSILRCIYIFKIYFYRLLACLDTVYDEEQVDMHSNIQKNVISLLRMLKINKLYKQRDIYYHLEKVYQKNSWSNSKYAGTITASLMRKEVMKKEIWGEGVLKSFETLKVWVPERYDIYLKKLYGNNYMEEEPNEDKRKSHMKN